MLLAYHSTQIMIHMKSEYIFLWSLKVDAGIVEGLKWQALMQANSGMDLSREKFIT